MDERVQIKTKKKLTADYVQNAVEDLIPSEEFIKGIKKALVENPITLAKAFSEEKYTGIRVLPLVQGLKGHGIFRVFLKSHVAPVAQRIDTAYSENTQSSR